MSEEFYRAETEEELFLLNNSHLFDMIQQLIQDVNELKHLVNEQKETIKTIQVSFGLLPRDLSPHLSPPFPCPNLILN